ncbi:hypothetical protein C7M84_002215 [Penaeus vannamei]|uniref:Uncharacterized protein n=1 Tax=Penaeus vannamei TaxID=6689 RepID=A0A423TRH8_PENVA|nr:hypothetical protein C7M84_002215 [Penaeus vannamei]
MGVREGGQGRGKGGQMSRTQHVARNEGHVRSGRGQSTEWAWSQEADGEPDASISRLEMLRDALGTRPRETAAAGLEQTYDTAIHPIIFSSSPFPRPYYRLFSPPPCPYYRLFPSFPPYYRASPLTAFPLPSPPGPLPLLFPSPSLSLLPAPCPYSSPFPTSLGFPLPSPPSSTRFSSPFPPLPPCTGVSSPFPPPLTSPFPPSPTIGVSLPSPLSHGVPTTRVSSPFPPSLTTGVLSFPPSQYRLSSPFPPCPYYRLFLSLPPLSYYRRFLSFPLSLLPAFLSLPPLPVSLHPSYYRVSSPFPTTTLQSFPPPTTRLLPAFLSPSPLSYYAFPSPPLLLPGRRLPVYPHAAAAKTPRAPCRGVLALLTRNPPPPPTRFRGAAAGARSSEPFPRPSRERQESSRLSHGRRPVLGVVMRTRPDTSWRHNLHLMPPRPPSPAAAVST